VCFDLDRHFFANELGSQKGAIKQTGSKSLRTMKRNREHSASASIPSPDFSISCFWLVASRRAHQLDLVDAVAGRTLVSHLPQVVAHRPKWVVSHGLPVPSSGLRHPVGGALLRGQQALDLAVCMAGASHRAWGGPRTTAIRRQRLTGTSHDFFALTSRADHRLLRICGFRRWFRCISRPRGRVGCGEDVGEGAAVAGGFAGRCRRTLALEISFRIEKFSHSAGAAAFSSAPVFGCGAARFLLRGGGGRAGCSGRRTWMSTLTPALIPKALEPATTFAVFPGPPTRGAPARASMRGGTAPPWCSDPAARGGTMFCLVARRSLLGMHVRLPPLRRVQRAAASASAKRSNRAGVTG